MQARLFILHLVMKTSIIQFKWLCNIISSLLLQNTEESKSLISELSSSSPLTFQVLEHIEDLQQLVDVVVADTASQEVFFLPAVFGKKNTTFPVTCGPCSSYPYFSYHKVRLL